MIKRSALRLVVSAGVLVAVFVVGCIYTFTRPPLYESYARVWVQARLPSDISGGQPSSIYAPLTYYFNSPIVTAGEVMKSLVVLEAALGALRRELPATQCPKLDEIRRTLKVDPVKDADVLMVRYRHSNPQVAASVVRALLDGFIKVNNLQSAGSATQSREFLEEQLRSLRQQYEQASHNLKKFQDAHGAVDLPEQVSVLLKRSADIEKDLEDTSRLIAEKKGKVSFLESQLGIRSQEAIVVQTLINDDMLKALRQKIAQDEVRLIDLQSKLHDSHPRMQQIKTSLERSKGALAERIRTLVGRLGTTTTGTDVPPDDPVRHGLIEEMVKTKSEEIALETRLSSLQQALQAAQSELAEIPSQQLRLAELTRAKDVASETLSEVEKRLQSAKLLESVASHTSNIQVIDRPEAARKPASPRLEVYLGITLFLALAASASTYLAFKRLDPTVKNALEATGILALPVGGWIDSLPGPTDLPKSMAAMQHLRVWLRNWTSSGRNRIVVLSATAADGKSTVSAALALSLSRAGTRVALVDANFARPVQHQIFKVAASPGLYQRLASAKDVSLASIQRKINENLHLFPAGAVIAEEPPPNAAALRSLFDEIQQQYDAVIVDTASTARALDALEWLDERSCFLVVVRIEHTTRQALTVLAAQLQQSENSHGAIVLADANEKAVTRAIAGPSTVAPKEASAVW